MNNKKVIAIIGAFAVIVVGYVFAINIDTDPPNIKEEAQNVKELVRDYSVGKLKAQSASVTSSQLVVTRNDDSKITYDMPEDEFFVSVAPYVEHTHPCANHSLTGCQGEMVNEEFAVYIEDKQGKVIIDQTLKSQSNGFIDLWLPRDREYVVTIENNGKSQVSDISTHETDDTCITTIQLVDSRSAI